MLEENLSNTGKRGAPSTEMQKLTAEDFAALTDNVQETVLNWDGYVEGSLVRNGDVLFWTGEDGNSYGYFPNVREKLNNIKLSSTGNNPGPRVLCDDGQTEKELTSSEISTLSFNCNDVAVFVPFDHLDKGWYNDNFFPNVQDRKIINAINAGNLFITQGGQPKGRCFTFTQSYATIDRIAEAIKTCKVVFIDSHGDTNYWKIKDGKLDCISGATTSYILLTGQGNLPAGYGDHNNGHVRVGTIKNDQETIIVWCVDGQAIKEEAFSGTTNSPFVWFGSCYSMATGGLCNPLLEMGVGVVYGYTNAVSTTFEQDCRSKFWGEMITYVPVKNAASSMKANINGGNAFETPGKIQTSSGEYPALGLTYPWFASSDQSYSQPENTTTAQSEVKSDWVLVDFLDPNPTDGSVTPGGGDTTPPSGIYDPVCGSDGVYVFDTLDPMRWSTDEEYEMTYYRGSENGIDWPYDEYGYHNQSPDWDYDSEYVFLRYEWEMGSDGNPTNAYAVFSTNYEVNDLYDTINENDGTVRYVLKHKETYFLDEDHHFCCKVKMNLSFDAVEGKWKAVIPKEHAPHTEGGRIDYVQYYDYTPAEYEKGWVFDHWEFTRASDGVTPETATVVYYNAWNTNDIKPVPVDISYHTSTGYYGDVDQTWRAALEADDPDNKDGVVRRAIVNSTLKKANGQYYSGWDGTDCDHLWLYDGVVSNGWDYSQFDSATGEGYATVTVKYHCAHGCGDMKTYTVNAYVTEKNGNDYTFTAFIGPKFIRHFRQENGTWMGKWDYTAGGIDNVTRYESTTKTYEPQNPPPDPSQPPAHEHEWVFDGFDWEGVEYDYATCKPYTEYYYPSDPRYVGDHGDALLRKVKIGSSIKAAYHCECGERREQESVLSEDGSWNGGIYWNGEIDVYWNGEYSSNSYYYPDYTGEEIFGMYRAQIDYLSLDCCTHKEDKLLESSGDWFFRGFEWDTSNGVKAYAVYHYSKPKTSGSGNGDVSTTNPSESQKNAWRKFDYWHYWNGANHYYDIVIKVPADVVKTNALTLGNKYIATIPAEKSANGYMYSATRTFLPKVPNDHKEVISPIEKFDPIPKPGVINPIIPVPPIKPIKPIKPSGIPR